MAGLNSSTTRKQQPKHKCETCGAAVWAGSKQCRPCVKRKPCECNGCGKTFIPKSKRYSTYCSRDCAFTHVKLWQKPPPRPKEKAGKVAPFCNVFFRVCLVCGNSFATRWERKVSCSDGCAYQYMLLMMRNNYEPKEPVNHSCATCGATFSANKATVYCSKKCVPKRSNHASRARHAGVAYESVNSVRVLERDGWRCQICGKNTPRNRRGTRHSNAPELDHRIPFALGGSHTYANTQCACRACNAMKGGTLIVGQIQLFNQ